MGINYEEKIIWGPVKDVRDKLRQAILEGWQVFMQEGTPRINCHDTIKVYLVRHKLSPTQKARLGIYDPDDRVDREG